MIKDMTVKQILNYFPCVGIGFTDFAAVIGIPVANLYSITSGKSSGKKYRDLIVVTLVNDYSKEYKLMMTLHREMQRIEGETTND